MKVLLLSSYVLLVALATMSWSHPRVSYFFIDKKGEQVSEDFERATSFAFGLAAVGRSGRVRIVDTSFKPVITNYFYKAVPVGSNVVWGAIEANGLGAIYEIRPFAEKQTRLRPLTWGGGRLHGLRQKSNFNFVIVERPTQNGGMKFGVYQPIKNHISWISSGDKISPASPHFCQNSNRNTLYKLNAEVVRFEKSVKVIDMPSDGMGVVEFEDGQRKIYRLEGDQVTLLPGTPRKGSYSNYSDGHFTYEDEDGVGFLSLSNSFIAVEGAANVGKINEGRAVVTKEGRRKALFSLKHSKYFDREFDELTWLNKNLLFARCKKQAMVLDVSDGVIVEVKVFEQDVLSIDFFDSGFARATKRLLR